eukprot:scaffold44494_cov303-Isochrysis_galbana.AAC.1
MCSLFRGRRGSRIEVVASRGRVRPHIAFKDNHTTRVNQAAQICSQYAIESAHSLCVIGCYNGPFGRNAHGSARVLALTICGRT